MMFAWLKAWWVSFGYYSAASMMQMEGYTEFEILDILGPAPINTN